MSFRFNNLKNLKRVSVTIPKDEDGFTGRECPAAECEGYFKIKTGTGLTAEDLTCTCPYCGLTGPPDTFWTKEQIKYARSIAIRSATEAFRKDLKSLEFEKGPSGPLGIKISMKLKPGALPPVRHYREKALETQVTCDSCTLDYSVFGVFAYCPDCAVHNSLLILNRNLDLVERQLTLADGVEEMDLSTHLIENALEDCVSAVDGFGREACLVRSDKSTNPKKCSNLSFQNLKRANGDLAELFGVDLSSSVSSNEWELAHARFMQRHLLAHKAGVIDQKFINDVGLDYGLVGRRVSIRSEEVRELLKVVATIGGNLIGLLPKPL